LPFHPTDKWCDHNAIRSQGAATDKFQRYDWGAAGNMKRYGQSTPPPYLLSNMPANLPVALFTGGTHPTMRAQDCYHNIIFVILIF
jgi:hypothetical protein